MSKLGPLQQSMAALFTPESERLRAAKKETEKGAQISAFSKLRESGKSGDSLGNPNSPGYESPLNEKKSPSSLAEQADKPQEQAFQVPGQSRSVIRLQAGWEKILVAQKKLCEKARNLFTSLEAPEKYRRKGGKLQAKSRGCIVDVDIKEIQDPLEEKRPPEKKPA